MSKIKIVTDSTAYIEKSFIEKHNVSIVPLSVNFEGSVQDEGYPGEFEGFFEKLSKSSDFPTTSQPSIGAFSEVFTKAIEEGFEVITITISSKLSGTFNSASAAATIVDKSKISVVDSLTSAANLKALVEKAITMSQDGLSREQIVAEIERMKQNTGIRLTVATLDYLKKGGRLSSAEALIGSLLNIKPVIGLIDGKLEPIAKVRGKKKAMEQMVQDIPSTSTLISICHINILDEAKEYETLIRQRFPNAKTTISELGPVVGSHLGPKAIGLCYVY